jgi:hypothetical protein
VNYANLIPGAPVVVPSILPVKGNNITVPYRPGYVPGVSSNKPATPPKPTGTAPKATKDTSASTLAVPAASSVYRNAVYIGTGVALLVGALLALKKAG